MSTTARTAAMAATAGGILAVALLLWPADDGVVDLKRADAEKRALDRPRGTHGAGLDEVHAAHQKLAAELGGVALLCDVTEFAANPERLRMDGHVAYASSEGARLAAFAEPKGRATITAGGKAVAYASWDAKPGHIATCQLEPSVSVTLEGTVLDGEGKPLEGVILGACGRRIEAAADGSFQVEGFRDQNCAITPFVPGEPLRAWGKRHHILDEGMEPVAFVLLPMGEEPSDELKKATRSRIQRRTPSISSADREAALQRLREDESIDPTVRSVFASFLEKHQLRRAPAHRRRNAKPVEK